MTVERLDALPLDQLRERLAACCGSSRWLDAMVARRPFGDAAALHAAADAAADRLDRDDWLEAFAHHPRIGDLNALRARFGDRSGSWSEGEQGGAVAAADDGVLRRLAEDNRRYEERFGHLFIVCASGKSAAEMLALLDARIDNPPAAELPIAAAEQRQITRLRLDMLLHDLGADL